MGSQKYIANVNRCPDYTEAVIYKDYQVENADSLLSIEYRQVIELHSSDNCHNKWRNDQIVHRITTIGKVYGGSRVDRNFKLKDVARYGYNVGNAAQRALAE